MSAPGFAAGLAAAGCATNDILKDVKVPDSMSYNEFLAAAVDAARDDDIYVFEMVSFTINSFLLHLTRVHAQT